MFPTAMLDTPTQRKILRVLSEDNKLYTSDELADICHRSESSISRALKKEDRFDFLEERNVSGSRERAYGLDSSSRYTPVIRRFFEIEKQMERKDTVPLKVWNFLEDIVSNFEKKNPGVVDVILFGSYAEGSYYAGSDIDLLLVHNESHSVAENMKKKIDDHVFSKDVQLLDIGVDESSGEKEVLEEVYGKSPIDEKDAYISLLGELES